MNFPKAESNQTDRHNLVGGLIREAARDRGPRRGRKGFGQARVYDIFPAQAGFGWGPGLAFYTSQYGTPANDPWYHDVWNFVKGIDWNIGAGPPSALQTSRLQPDISRMPPQLQGAGGCSFYQKRTQLGCQADPVIIGLMIAGGVLAIKLIK